MKLENARYLESCRDRAKCTQNYNSIGVLESHIKFMNIFKVEGHGFEKTLSLINCINTGFINNHILKQKQYEIGQYGDKLGITRPTHVSKVVKFKKTSNVLNISK